MKPSSEQFDSLTIELRSQVKKSGLTKKDIKLAIQEARRKKD